MKDKQIISRYAHLFTIENQDSTEYLVYNSRNNSFSKIDKGLYTILQKYNENSQYYIELIAKDALSALQKAKILVSEDEDDNFVRQSILRSNLDSYASSHLSLSIAPTSGCNFRCPYCYEENKPNITMTDETINNIINFINEHQSLKTMGITWYGGEPLTAFDTIKKILNEIKSKSHIKLTSQAIVTNGYNFNQEVIDFFNDQNLGKIQITIDGPEEEHNKRRMLQNGKGTFQKIISNLKNIVTGLPNTHIQIRINIDKNNQDGFITLYKELKELFNSRIAIYPGYIRINNKFKTDITCDSIDQNEARLFYDRLEKDGNIKVNYYPQIIKQRGCVATCTTAYVIGPSGEIYKCWNDMGYPEKIVGYVDQDKLTNPKLYNQYLIDGQWTSDEECKKCFFLPICSAGCAWQRIRNKFHKGTYDYCSLYKGEGIDKYLELYYKKNYLLTNNTD